MVGARGSTVLWWELGGPLYYGGSQGVHCIMVGARGYSVKIIATSMSRGKDKNHR